MKLNQRGFTIIEVLFVLVMLALLVSIALPRYLKSLETAKKQVLHETLNQTREAINSYYRDTSSFPVSLETLVEKGYLNKLPINPYNNSDKGWSYEYDNEKNIRDIKTPLVNGK
ncbi:MAG: prepilin-type N-terminal cleavage/methylation domain-containing protein [Methylacidiphilales bacterium]|nr:prepilin-type N-terminal cleavage/methylation domain-containing protein [Candidatus Methylacidiphilales bacterium]